MNIRQNCAMEIPGSLDNLSHKFLSFFTNLPYLHSRGFNPLFVDFYLSPEGDENFSPRSYLPAICILKTMNESVGTEKKKKTFITIQNFSNKNTIF